MKKTLMILFVMLMVLTAVFAVNAQDVTPAAEAQPAEVTEVIPGSDENAEVPVQEPAAAEELPEQPSKEQEPAEIPVTEEPEAEETAVEENVVFDVTVTIEGAQSSVEYDGEPHAVSGFKVVEIDCGDDNDYVDGLAKCRRYTEEDFIFEGRAYAERKDPGRTMMGLSEEMFVNKKSGIASVTFVITDGYQEITGSVPQPAEDEEEYTEEPVAEEPQETPVYTPVEEPVETPILIIHTELPTPEPTEEPVAEEPTEEPAVEELTEEPAVEEPTEEPVVEEPTEEPAAEEPTEEPVAEEPTEEPVAEEPTEEPAVEEPTEEPSAEEPTEEPAAEEPTEEPVTEEPTGEPAAEEPTEEPVTEEPTEEPAEEELNELSSNEIPAAEDTELIPAEGEEAAEGEILVVNDEAETPAEEQVLGLAKAAADIRIAADGMSDIFVTLDEETELVILGIEGDWVLVELPDGTTGYIFGKDIELPAEEEPTETETDEQPAEPAEQTEAVEQTAAENPKKVTIFTSRRTQMTLGEEITLTSLLEGFENCEKIKYQWECDKGSGFEPVEGANADSFTYPAAVETLSWSWRLMVYYK